MKLPSLKLGFKTLSLVSILLAFELVFAGCYFVLLGRAEEDATKQRKAKEIIARVNDLCESLYVAGDNVSKSVFHPEQSSVARYETAIRAVSVDLASLKELLQSDPEQRQLFERIEPGMSESLALISKMKEIIDREPQVVALRYAIKLRTKMQKRMKPMVQDLILFLNTEKKIESEIPAALKFQRDCLRWLLVGALLVNILAALLVATFFIRSVTSRLGVVVDNSDRLRQRKMLRSPLPGNDEIAQLDRAFHEMSSSLRGEEELVKANELQIRAMIDQMPIGLMIIADQETIEYANPNLDKFLNYQSGELVGSVLSKHFAKTGTEPRPLNDTATVDGITELIAYTSNRNPLNVEFSVVDVSLGTSIRRLAIVVDVTERHAVEKMRQAFVAMVSHELRTPLTSVAGFLQLLPMGVYGSLEPVAVNEAGRAEMQVEQLIMLINDLLDLEKLEAGKLALSKTKVFLEDIIDAALDSVYGLAELQNVEVMFEGCEVNIVADSERLRQAISKMLTCMLKLCPKGGTLNVIVSSGSGNEVTIGLSNPSLSISAEKLQTIFEPFQHLGVPGLSGSLGLGLTLSRAIAVQHGGICGASSAADGGGTSLWLKLPGTA
jgi:signal transduction histidine kinase